jgi:dihydroorotate dehydrogenase
MGALYEKWLKPALFRIDPERAHELGVAAMAMLGRLAPLRRLLEDASRLPEERSRPIEAFGLRFTNAVGLAAGFDKNARVWPAAAALGFGHVEVGTVTARSQPGNPRPRLFRFPAELALINRLGFNNDGARTVAGRLAKSAPAGRRRIPLGINIGKSRAVDVDQAVQDYLASFNWLADHADYLVLNVSSPNTPGLRTLQDEPRLRELLRAVTEVNRSRATQPERRSVPLLLKIAPDLEFAQIDAVLGVIEEFKLDGVIATNTTIARPGRFGAIREAGGLSGAPLRWRSTEIIRYIAGATRGRLPIIGVGGITDPAGAAEKLDAGATLVQVYTGFVFGGPFFARDLARGVADRQRRSV